ncbi:bifunctional lysylphosphatidylglycerol flippase/synthetase MprF [Bacillus massiliigorillae]|uniref:bifunctional lysylphosphatidylglycerol flippase/synthetase MprF n=1 Tax=Bacillus massiliigorillae TaxID=1243664 RepID=UPI0003A8D323|nr:bifunctional lysylphosphatidylglycerol flippase/synthetase MprF [Bacillus massiliigorillae]
MDKIKKIGKIAIPLLVILYVIYHAKTELQSISIREAIRTIHLLSSAELTLLIILGLLSVFVMAFYDVAMIKGLGLAVPLKKCLRIGFIANSLNIVLGFGGLAGATVRHAIYRSYTKDTKKLLFGITWATTATLMGLSILALLILINLIPDNNLMQNKPWMFPVIIGMALLMPIYFATSFVREKKNPSSRTFNNPIKTVSALTIVSLLEWLCAGSILFLLLEMFQIDTSYSVVLGVFVIASILGVISFVPGGFGSFDLTFLIGMSSYGYHEETILSVLLVYRIVYFFIPFLLSLLLTVLEFSSSTLRKIESKPIIGPALETTGVVWALYRELLTKLWDWALCILLFVTAWINIASVLILPFQTPLISKGVSNFSYNLIFTFSVIILLNLRGIFNRTKKSYYFVMVGLIGSCIAHLLKSFDYEEAIILAVIIGILIIIRKQFQIESVLISFFYYIFSAIIGAGVILLYYVMGTSITTIENASDFRSFPQVLETSIFALCFVPILIGLGTYIFRKIRVKDLGIPYDREKLHSFLQQYKGNSLTHLGYMGDKRMFFSSNGKALILFRKYRNRLVVLGDPSGEHSSYSLVLNEFMNEANNYGYVVVFYQIDQSTMHLYHDFGYQFFKLGEEACVNIDTFSISGKKQSNFRANYNRFNREGYTFELFNCVTDEQLKEMEIVSNQWLGKRKEKGFSMGVFCKDYVKEGPICLVRDVNGTLLAFASLMPAYDENKISIDLMRHLPEAPVGTMDTLFLHLIFWAKEQGYHTFNLGMAPLSNVGTQNESFLAERIAGTIFNNVRYMYSFSGLRRFKGKYHPKWQGKYLAFRKNKTLFASIILVTRMIGKGNPIEKTKKVHKKVQEKQSLPS